MSRRTDQQETLEDALKRCYGDASKSLWSQARIAACHVGGMAKGWALNKTVDLREAMDFPVRFITEVHIKQATANWYAHGQSPATINKRLNCLSKMGVSVEGLRVKDPKKLKWHMSFSKADAVMAWLWDRDTALSYGTCTRYGFLASYIWWAMRTGLRVQESLEVYRDCFTPDFAELRVPGTKTKASEATIPLGPEVQRFARDDMFGPTADGLSPKGGFMLFPLSYSELLSAWDEVREHFGFTDPTATLKALRRSAARYLHVDRNMPLHMVQQYLRHESMDTTLEYLRLTGGYGTEEMRRYLK